MSMSMERMGKRGYTGGFLESDMFGERFEKKRSDADAEYVSYKDAVAEVKEDYPDNPGDPGKRFANNLHAEVAQELNLDDWEELHFYTAVGSRLDRFHGVDAFFEFDGRQVTLDATKNPAKTEADISADFRIGEEEFNLPVRRAEMAGDIADLLR